MIYWRGFAVRCGCGQGSSPGAIPAGKKQRTAFRELAELLEMLKKTMPLRHFRTPWERSDVIENKLVMFCEWRQEKQGPQNEGISVDVYENKGQKN
jgi:hypothetical protein